MITYEEYYPYGSTSLPGRASAAEVSLKRYRYSGKERDAENGLVLPRGPLLRAVARPLDLL